MTKKRHSKWDYSPEAAKYRQNYLETHYVKLQAFVAPEYKQEIVQLAKNQGLSITQYLLNALDYYKNK